MMCRFFYIFFLLTLAGGMAGAARADSDDPRAYSHGINAVPDGKGGHLVVAFDVGNKSIVCNHPSSYDPMNKQKWEVELDKWEASFSRNYMEFMKLSAVRESQ